MTVAADQLSWSAQPLRVEGDDRKLSALARREGLALTPAELRAIAAKLDRFPTRAEAHAFAIQWSEHCSYKSSRKLLSRLPTQSADVLVGVGEDAGVLRIAEIDGVAYGVVVAHESHNHPSQVVPFEGAATGVGGILRDVLCMGARVVASADPLRFGSDDPGTHAGYVAASVVDGIAAYGNAVGVPNIAGDVYFHESFADNALVNVVALGIVRADRIIHSRVPADGAGYDLILVGKATDASGFGGAAFASLVLDAGEAQTNKSAVQVPDPFLKNVLMRATYAVCDEAFARGIAVGFKDLGAGGIMGSSSELCAAGGFGASIDVDAVPQAAEGLAPHVVICSETQERMLWAVPPSFTPTVLHIYNDRFGLPNVAADAKAVVIGSATRERRYRASSHGAPFCDVPIEVLVGSIAADRIAAADDRRPQGLADSAPLSTAKEVNVDELLLSILSHRDVCSRRPLIEHYDMAVRGATVIPSGYADAGVIVVARGARAGIAVSVDGNPRYGAVSARLAAEHAVVEAARNVAAVGAQPIGLTDCLNYGNPEDPIAFRQLQDGIDGLARAARALQLNEPGEPLPFVSGNVSLYNDTPAGGSIAPSAIVACIGRVVDIGNLVTMQLTGGERRLLLLGSRSDHLGGSVFESLMGAAPDRELPPMNYAEANASIRAVIEAIRVGAVTAAHDISDGGLAACVAEMCFGGDGDGAIGVRLASPGVWAPGVSAAAALFGEDGGFVVEVPPERLAAFEAICTSVDASPIAIGITGGSAIHIDGLCDVPLERAAAAWMQPLRALYG